MYTVGKLKFSISILSILLLVSCLSTEREIPQPIKEDPPETSDDGFYFGADLSYVNQILDHGGEYMDGGIVKNPYEIFSDRGTNLARFRLWHNPIWTGEVYDESGTQLYNDLLDVEKSISLSKAQGMEVMLDFHYSDVWADPGRQDIPAAWLEITDIDVLSDSVYNYTFKTLTYLEEKGLMPEFVQIGNEINCGLFSTDVPDDFPVIDNCNAGEWENFRAVLKSGIKATRDVATTSGVDTQIILHVADPVTVDWWFENVMNNGEISNFDIIGFSYYPIWHTGIGLDQLEATVAGFKTSFNKEVMIMEVAYPWTTDGNDEYNNSFSGNDVVAGYPATPDGQLALMVAITQALKNGGGNGIVYWEPAWITSDLRDLWNAGSSWENNAFFDFNGNANQAFDYITHEYD